LNLLHTATTKGQLDNQYGFLALACAEKPEICLPILEELSRLGTSFSITFRNMAQLKKSDHIHNQLRMFKIYGDQDNIHASQTLWKTDRQVDALVKLQYSVGLSCTDYFRTCSGVRATKE
jgi:hypothetical protein